MDETLHLNEFFVEGGSQTTSHVLLHLTEPSTPEEKQKGYFFAVAELNDTPPEIIANVQSLIDDIENAYYETEDGADKTALEIVVASFNAATTLTEQTANKLHCLVGALRGEEILLTYVGKPLTALFYKNRQGGYQQMDLLENGEGTEDTSQLFQQFVQGKMSAGDFILLGTPHITDHFNLDRLEKIITTRPSRESAEHLERVLGGLNNSFSFGGLIIHREATGPVTPKKSRPEKTEITSAESLRHLLSTEKNTSETLSPSFIPRMQEKLKQSVTPSQRLSSAAQTTPASVSVRAPHLQTHRARPRAAALDTRAFVSKAVPVIISFFRATVLGVTYVMQTIGLVVVSVARFFGALFFIITNVQGRRRTIIENWNREWRGRKENFRQLSVFTKILVTCVILGCAGLAIGIALVRHNQKVAAAQKQFNDAIAVINLKKDAAESALIYRDENKANAELGSAITLFNSLPCTDKENITSCKDMARALSDLSIKLSKRTPVAATVIATWNESTAPRLSNLIKLGTKIVATTASSTRLYLYDTASKVATTVETGFVAGTITNLTAPKENDYAVAIVDQKDVYLLDPADWHLKKADVTFPNPVNTLTSAVVYNRRLYSLDAGGNHLYKHDAIKNGFGMGKEWLGTTSTSLQTGTDLAIDGDVYVLGSNGTVQKFTSGEKVAWNMPTLEPALTTASRIFTYNDVENLYVLDTVGKRLIVLKKDGTLIAQLVDSAWVNPTDMVIDEPAYTAYVVDGNRLYKVDLPR